MCPPGGAVQVIISYDEYDDEIEESETGRGLYM